LAAVIIFASAIYANGSSGRAQAADEAGLVSARADAKVVIHNRVELRQDGSVKSGLLDRYEPIQVNAHECDPEIRRIEAECIFLIYEIQ
tara:strand:+ start:250 stop:516 length:267 start_codon:yes stop_codon:yes gene_type:complete